MGFVFNVEDFEASLDALKLAVNQATKGGVSTGAHLIEANAKRRFTGPPGPTTQTGTLRRSISLIPREPVSTGAWSWTVAVAPTTVYGRRVELGFIGTDSLGRVFGPPLNPARYPFLTPGFVEALPTLPRVFSDTWQAALGG